MVSNWLITNLAKHPNGLAYSTEKEATIDCTILSLSIAATSVLADLWLQNRFTLYV
jgi:hypothetical protein